MLRGYDGEETSAAARVYGGGRGRGTGENGVPNVVGQREQDGVFVLEERASLSETLPGLLLLNRSSLMNRTLLLSMGISLKRKKSNSSDAGLLTLPRILWLEGTLLSLSSFR